MGHVFASIDDLVAAGKEGGVDLGTTGWVEVTQSHINQFADATGDHQWIHVDVERAKEGPFGGPIAHGYLTLALAAPFLFELFQVEGASMAINYGLNKVRFPAPVPAGSKVRAHGKLVSARRKGPMVEAVIALEYELEGSDRSPCVAEVVILVAS